MEAKISEKRHSVINGRNVWHYLIETPIGNIHVVEYEQPGKEIKRFLIDENNEVAEKKYRAICAGISLDRI